MFKKIMALVLVMALTAAVAIGGTVAYLTDRDSEANVFTVGDVSIRLDEDFEQGAELIPGVEIAKKPVITNTGKNDAWVWLEFAIPSALDNYVQGTETGSNENVIHWNPLGATAEGYVNDTRVENAITAGYLPEGTTAAKITADKSTWNVFNSLGEGKNAYQTKINEVDYNVYVLLYNKALTPGETTLPSIYKVFLDAQVDIDTDGNWYRVVEGKATDLKWNSYTNGNPVIYASAYAAQAEGFNTVNEAYAAYTEQWTTADNVNNGLEWATPGTLVATADELEKVLAEGGSVILTEDISMPENKRIDIPANGNAVIDLNGHTLTSKDGGGSNTMAIYVSEGATLTLDDSAGGGQIVSSCYGVYVKQNATFIMNGGTLNVSGNGVYDMGVIVWNGTFIMNGGTINAQYGVWASNYYSDTTPNAGYPVCKVTVKETAVMDSTSGTDIDIGDAPNAVVSAPDSFVINTVAESNS